MRIAILGFLAVLALSPPVAAQSRGLPPDHLGFIVLDAESGRVLAEQRPDTAVVPASVSKLPTAIASVSIMGGDSLFATELALSGSTLVLVGGGDPLLTPEALRPAIRRLKEGGLRIDRFLFDVSIWPETSEIDPAQPEASGYNPGVGALALDFNRVLVDWKASGRDMTVLAVSDALRLKADAFQLLPAPGKVAPPFRFLAEGADRWLFANLPAQGRIWLPVKQPALNAALVFRRLAEREGVVLPMPQAGRRPPGARTLHMQPSQPLSEIVRLLLQHSNNMAAEMVGLATAAQIGGGPPASLAESALTVDAWLRAEYPQINWTGYGRTNHSGLSPASRATPRQMAELLRQALARTPLLVDLLPAREIAEADEGEARPENGLSIRAKSGTMAYARGLTGVLWTQSGRRVVFSVFHFDPVRRAAFDATLDRRLPEMPAEARSWIRAARVVERDLLRGWAAAY